MELLKRPARALTAVALTLQGVGAQDSTDSQGKASETALCPAGHGKDLLGPGAGLPVSVGCVAGHLSSWTPAA